MDVLSGALGELFPLSLNQYNIWDLERTFFGTSINSIGATIRFKGKIDYMLIEKALNIIISTDISLRTQIANKDGIPLQYHIPHKDMRFPIIDFTTTDEEGIKSWEKASIREPFKFYDSPLYRFVLMKIKDNIAGILVITHHIISDGWTQVSLCNRIARIYIDLVAEREPDTETLPSYSTFVEEEQKYLTSQAYIRDKKFWQDLTQNLYEPASIKNIKSAVISPVGKQISFNLSEELNDLIYSYCLKNRIAPFLVFYMALSVYLKRIGGSDRFSVGVPVFNRTNQVFKKTTGMFVSTIPFYNEISSLWSFDELKDVLSENWLEVLRHQRFPFNEIKHLSGSEGALFNIMLSYQDSKVHVSDFDQIEFSGYWHYGGYQAEQLCIHMMNLEDNRRYSVDYEYLVQLFTEKEIRNLHSSLCNILLSALKAPELKINEINIISPEEYQSVIYDFNRTSKPIEYVNPYNLLLKTLCDDPNRTALIYKGEKILYRDLINVAGRVASCINESAELVAILLPRIPKLFSAMAGIMQSGAAWVIISPELPSGRIIEILKKSGADAIITTSDIFENIEGVKGLNIPFINMDKLPAMSEKINVKPADSLAYVVYTSGSTGTPKGVEITKLNLINLTLGVAPLLSSGPVISLCNIGFDAFVLESAVSLLCGKTIILPEDEEQENPAAIGQLIKDYTAGFMAITPSRLAAYMKNSAFSTSLKSVESIVCGGEAFPSELIQKIKQFSKAKVFNQYGPSETTVGVSYSLLNESDNVTVGKPMDNCRLYILDENMNPLPVGIYGELYVGGICVGKGYRNEPLLTEKSFFNSRFEPGERMYKTGDIAAWTDSGEIIISGRRDKQVKLRGLRIEPQEISACLLKHPLVLDAAVKVNSNNGQQLLLAYCVTSKPVPETELLTFAASYLPRYMIPARVINLDSIPLTPNGKIDETALPIPDGDDGLQLPSNLLQEQLVTIFREVLGNSEFHAGSDYFLSGGNSLNAMEAIGEIEDKTGIRLRVSDLYACRTVKRLDEYITGMGVEIAAAKTVFAAPKQDKYTPTDMQKNVYVQSFMDPTRLAYNMPGAFRLGACPDVARLENAFISLIESDDNFRTSFIQQGAEVSAVINEEVPFRLTILSGNREEAFNNFVQPFDLSKAPLIRAALLKDDDNSWFLLVDSHHIICDGLSTPLILERINQIYTGKGISVPLTYKNFAYYSKESVNKSFCASKDYWLKALSPLPDNLDIPLDSPRPSVFDYKGGNISFSLSEELTKLTDEFCGSCGITPYMFLLGVFGILMSKASDQKDFVVGTPVTNRLRPELLKVCGLFINTIPLRLKPEGNINEYFNGIRDCVIGALDNPNIPLDTIITELNIPRSLSKNPLYQVLFSMRPLDASSFVLDGNRLEYVPISTRTTKLDLSFEVAKELNVYKIFVEYCRTIFTEGTIKLYSRSFISIIEEILYSKVKNIEEIDAISPQDKAVYFYKRNKELKPFVDKPINRIIVETALANPDKTAVIWHDNKISFKELNKRSDSIASLLIKNGVERGDRIGLSCMRTPDLFASMIGILKAGAAYVPFLTDYPAERIYYMLENAGARLLLSDPDSRKVLPDVLPCSVILTTEAEASEPVSRYQETTDPMYVLYTSGSTGQPKGVQVPHKAIANLLECIKSLMYIHEGPVLCTTNVTFDIFVTESLLALAQGYCVVLADEEEMIFPWKIAELIKKHHTTITQFTPSRLQMNLNNDAFASAASIIEFVILVGEAVTPQLVEKFKSHSSGRFVNMYGPTEAAVYVTQGEQYTDKPVDIGVELNNCRIYVLDEKKNPVLPTARGELYLAGVCLADGYISRPDLTDAVFVPDPFFPGQKMYKSGDSGRVKANGIFECFGRLDSQIKINGIRVELDEIKSAMQKSGALQAAVVAEKNPDSSTSLYGFVTPEDININVFKSKLSKVIPSYMIPSKIIPMERLPYNASGKVDLPVLKKIATSADSGAKVLQEIPPAESIDVRSNNNNSKYGLLLDIWSNTLGNIEIDPDIPFFEQGGSSLGALNVLSQYFNNDLIMTLAEFYENPTLKQQAELLRINPEEQKSSSKPKNKSFGPKFHASVPRLKVPVSINPFGCFLLTGATGFLGAHILYELLARGAKKIICPLRDGDFSRLYQTLTWYFGKAWTTMNSPYIEVVKGDITQPKLGINPETYERICKSSDAIYHTAADVRHYTNGSSSNDVNLKGTENVIDLALFADIPMIHISTTSISGDYVRGNLNRIFVFKENDFDIGQNWEDNIYVKTKFLAENAVYNAIESRGLKAKVFRIGRIVGRILDGKFQKNADTNAFYSLIKSIGRLGVLSESLASMPIEMTPVDTCAKAILKLENTSMTAFHVLQPDPSSLGEILSDLYKDFDIVDVNKFLQKLSECSASGDNMSVAPLIEMCNRLKNTPQNIVVSSTKTQKQLESLDFYWPSTITNNVLASFK